MKNYLILFAVIPVAAATKLFLYPSLNSIEPSSDILVLISAGFIPLLMIKDLYHTKNIFVLRLLYLGLCVASMASALFASYSFKNHNISLTLFFSSIVLFVLVKTYFMHKEEK